MAKKGSRSAYFRGSGTIPQHQLQAEKGLNHSFAPTSLTARRCFQPHTANGEPLGSKFSHLASRWKGPMFLEICVFQKAHLEEG